MTNPTAMQKAAAIHGIVLALLRVRSQAMPIWTRKQLRRELENMGYPVSLDTVRRVTISIRGRGVRNL